MFTTWLQVGNEKLGPSIPPLEGNITQESKGTNSGAVKSRELITQCIKNFNFINSTLLYKRKILYNYPGYSPQLFQCKYKLSLLERM